MFYSRNMVLFWGFYKTFFRFTRKKGVFTRILLRKIRFRGIFTVSEMAKSITSPAKKSQ